jgi:putative phosphoribosyl transferase
MRFRDRVHAGRELATQLEHLRDRKAVVYALPRGGAIVGAEVARRLGAPLDLILTRKIGHPLSKEYAIGAVSEGDAFVCSQAEIARVEDRWFQQELERQRAEIRRQRAAYEPHIGHTDPQGKTVIVVDDGVATGLTLRAAVRSLRERAPETVVVAVPVAPEDTAGSLQEEADAFIAVYVPRDPFGSVGLYYEDFTQVDDAAVCRALESCRLPQR